MANSLHVMPKAIIISTAKTEELESTAIFISGSFTILIEIAIWQISAVARCCARAKPPSPLKGELLLVGLSIISILIDKSAVARCCARASEGFVRWIGDRIS